MNSHHQSARFLMRLAAALHRYGTPTHRLEEAINKVSSMLNVEGQYLVTPTSIMASIGPEGEQEMRLLRVDSGETNLEKLASLNDVMRRAGTGETDVETAADEVQTICAAPLRYIKPLTVLGYTIVSGAATAMFGGGLNELVVGMVVGTLLGLLAVAALGRPRLTRPYPALASFLATMTSGFATLVLEPLHPFISTLGGLIVLVPGLALTIAINELASGHVVSGSSRLVSTLMTFLQMGIGVAFGTLLLSAAGIVVDGGTPVQFSAWFLALWLPLAAAGFTILFRARPRDFPWILLASVIAFLGARYTAELAGPVAGAACGAWALGSTSNVLARLRDEPAVITLLPGLLLLVPGSIGFRSVEAMIRDDILSGIEAGVSMGLTAMALVTGLLLANLTIESRKLL
ncbi:MAG: threonine/serine exporter family protein [Gammaproteobacteria bacterium]|nr:threonine/serine exporter family protein [Gammaproteobacteria bacterium]NNF60506.1 threonine/serine exporter family protein [Gammaproteobacteria bacterium]